MEAKIRELVASNPGQLSVAEYSLIYATLREASPCNFLSFSTGNDVKIWLHANRGKNLFLEHDPRWVELTLEQSPTCEVHHITYSTKVRHARIHLADPTRLGIAQMPEVVRKTRWDVIFVDGPTGYAPDCPGRFQSIWEAVQMNPVDLFIHDVDRPVEAQCCAQFLKSYWFRKRLDRMYHYRLR